MQRVTPIVFAVFVLAARTSGVGVTPVQQVIDMLKDMKAKGDKAAATEKLTFTAYKQWVSDHTTSIGFEITTLKSKIEKLTAAIDKMDSDVATHSSHINELDEEMSKVDSEQKSSAALREKEHADYQTNHADHAESVYALERAIQTLKARALDTPQASAFLQEMARQTPQLRPAVAAFLMDSDSAAMDSAPAVAAYKFQSGGIVEVLEKLHDKFKSELSDIEMQEANGAHAHAMKTQHLEAISARLKADHCEMTALKGKIMSESGA
jgi:hypothetical protein